MVASGFAPDSTAVAPGRLTIHLVLALLLYSAIVWTGLSALRLHPGTMPALLRRLTMAATLLVFLTIIAGGFVAGLHAGLDYNTFPLMDGRLVPAGYADLHPFPRNLTENIATVQFDHRLLATLSVLAIGSVLTLGFPVPGLRARLCLVGTAVVLQYGLGVATLLWAVPLPLASAHQVGATLLLTALLVLLHALRPVPRA
jgi:cytochrome c oxidase assembly protein subunit 15